MGALDDLIAARPNYAELDDVWHRKIAEARALRPPLPWPKIAAAIAEDTGTEPYLASTLMDTHHRWVKRQG